MYSMFVKSITLLGTCTCRDSRDSTIEYLHSLADWSVELDGAMFPVHTGYREERRRSWSSSIGIWSEDSMRNARQ